MTLHQPPALSSPPQSRPLLPARPGLPPSETLGPQRRPGLWPGPTRARPCVLGLCLSCLPVGRSSVCLSRRWSAPLWPRCCPESSEHPFCVGRGEARGGSGHAGWRPPAWARRVGGAGGVRPLRGSIGGPEASGQGRPSGDNVPQAGLPRPRSPVACLSPAMPARERLWSSSLSVCVSTAPSCYPAVILCCRAGGMLSRQH